MKTFDLLYQNMEESFKADSSMQLSEKIYIWKSPKEESNGKELYGVARGEGELACDYSTTKIGILIKALALLIRDIELADYICDTKSDLSAIYIANQNATNLERCSLAEVYEDAIEFSKRTDMKSRFTIL